METFSKFDVILSLILFGNDMFDWRKRGDFIALY